MDDVEPNNENMAPIAEEESVGETVKGKNDEFMSISGGEYLEERLVDFEEELNYNWGDDGDKLHNLLKYLKDKPTLMGKFDKMLADIKMERNEDKKIEKIRLYKYLLKDAVSIYKDTDELNKNKWGDVVINLEEREKFLWEQKINNVNHALENEGIKLDRKNKELYNYLKENLKETFTDGDRGQKFEGNINGYKYGGKKIIKRTTDRTFIINEKQKKEAVNFIERMKKFVVDSARSEIINILGSDENTEITARECISELRDAEKRIIGGARTVEELTDSRGTIEKIEKNIRNIKQNEKFTIDKRIVFNTLEGKLAKIRLWAEENKGSLGVGGASLLISIVSGLATSIPLIEKIKNAGKTLKKLGRGIEKAGKNISNFGKKLDNIFTKPTEALGAIVGLTGNIFENFGGDFIPILIILIIIIVILYVINKWIGVF